MRGAEALDSVLPLVTIAQLDLDAAQGFLVAVDREQHRIRHGGENTAAGRVRALAHVSGGLRQWCACDGLLRSG